VTVPEYRVPEVTVTVEVLPVVAPGAKPVIFVADSEKMAFVTDTVFVPTIEAYTASPLYVAVSVSVPALRLLAGMVIVQVAAEQLLAPMVCTPEL
jgi:hypothetical protein